MPRVGNGPHRTLVTTAVRHHAQHFRGIGHPNAHGAHITPCHRLATQAELGGLKVQIGSMLETSIASSAGFHLALSHPNIVSTELSGPLRFAKEPGDLKYVIPDVHITEKPGLGVDVDLDVLAELTVSEREVSR